MIRCQKVVEWALCYAGFIGSENEDAMLFFGLKRVRCLGLKMAELQRQTQTQSEY